jgi:hypothetical protein
MKYAFFFAAFCSPLTLFAQELPIKSHVGVCGAESVDMSDEDLSEMQVCTLEQRDAMGYLMDRWSSYTAELRQACVARTSSGAAVDYAELEACMKEDA